MWFMMEPSSKMQMPNSSQFWSGWSACMEAMAKGSMANSPRLSMMFMACCEIGVLALIV